MKIAVIGTGGVGGYFGGKLALAGNDVTFLARGEHLTAIRENGLLVKSIKGDFLIHPVHATDRINELGMPELIMVCVKAWQVLGISRDLAPLITKNTVVMPMQNGILAVDELKKHIDQSNIIGGLCRIISKISSPGVIAHLGVEPLSILGELDNSKTERVQSIKEVFDEAGVNAKIADDIYVELWMKFISICAGGLLAVTRSTYGEVRELEPTRKIMIELLHEIHKLSLKAGIGIEPEFVDKAIHLIDAFPYNSSSSLARDVWEGKPSEIEYQNGTVVRLAEKYGMEVPINRFIYNCILPMELRARKKANL